MLTEIIYEAWIALRRNRTRSALTMLGIVWGIATVTLLIAYGNSFRSVLVNGFNAFGKGAVICWPQQTSEQPGGQRAGKKVVFEKEDVDADQGDRSSGETRVPRNRAAARYRLRRSHVGNCCRCAASARSMARCATKSPPKAAGSIARDELERRRVIFLGGRLREQLFSGRPAVGETVLVAGVPFQVVGVMARKIQLSNYFSSDDRLCPGSLLGRRRSVEHAIWGSDACLSRSLRSSRSAPRPRYWPRSHPASSSRPPTRKRSRCSAARSFVRSLMA